MRLYCLKNFCRYIFVMLLSVVCSSSLVAASSSNSWAAETIDHALENLLAQVEPEAPAFTLAGDIAPLVEMVRAGDMSTEIELPAIEKMSSAAYFFTVKTSMERLLKYGYNPDLPTYLVAPNTVRRGEWTQVNGKKQPLPKMWEFLGGLEKPVVITGKEHEEITPDIFSGGYYSYDMDRMMLLLKYQGKPVLVSITRQCDPSDVGKKGAVVGQDSEWQYLYSGVDGLTKGGMGWVSSYMYSAMSVTLFSEIGTPEAPVIKAGVFKWLRAGWAGINMVRTHHIEEGCARFATSMRSILENSNLPPQEEVVDTIEVCETLSTGELRTLIKPYLDHLQGLDDPLVRKSPFKKLLRSGDYLKTMPREDMVKILVTGYLKKMMGEGSLVDTTSCRKLAAKRTALLK